MVQSRTNPISAGFPSEKQKNTVPRYETIRGPGIASSLIQEAEGFLIAVPQCETKEEAMNVQIKILSSLILLFTVSACQNKTSNAVDNGVAGTPIIATLSVYVANPIVALSGTTTVTVTGGSGPYTATAALGTIVAGSVAGTFNYTAPASASSTSETITVTDSNSLVGRAYLTISGGTGTAPTLSCSGTYTFSVSGGTGTLVLVSNGGGSASGYIYLSTYYYPVNGTCSITGTSGTISVSDAFYNNVFSGTVTSNGTSGISMSGTVNGLAWTASPQTAPIANNTPANSCEGNFSATMATNSGTLKLVQDGSGKFAGTLTLNGYPYAMTGSCTTATSITMTNNTTGSTYTGTVTRGTNVSITGTYTIPGGATYTWSAVK